MDKLHFYPRFVDSVATGAKTRSIRNKALTVGGKVQLIGGMESCGATRIGTAIITRVRPVVIEMIGGVPFVILDGVAMDTEAMSRMAHEDGFRSLDEFVDFFESNWGLPYRGYLNEWRILEEPTTNMPIEEAALQAA